MVDPHPALVLIPEHEVERAFAIARATAIAWYTHIEKSLASFFAHLMGVSEDYAGVSFFRINNARARNAMLERLLKKRHGGTYNIFWNSLVKQLQALDETRNQIVHWTTVTHMSDKGRDAVTLIPPNHWDRDWGNPGAPEITVEHLYEFILKCDFYSRMFNIFTWTLSGQREVDPTWQQIFQQPVIYPPPNSHPLYRKPQVP